MLIDNQTKERIKSAIKLATKTNSNILFSISYHAKNNILNLINNKNFSNKIKIYFSLKNKGHEILGLGCTVEIREPITNPEKINSRIKSHFLNSIHITNNTPANPKFLMGFAFDEKQKQEEWDNFGNGKIILPTIQLEKINGTHYNTISMLIRSTDQEASIIRSIKDIYNKINLITCETTSHSKPKINLDSSPSKLEYTNQIEEIVRTINQGDVEKVVLSRYKYFTIDDNVNIVNVLEQIINSNNSTLVYYFKFGSSEFVGISPEKLLVREGKMIRSDAIAGTKETSENINLLDDDKILNEHMIVADYIIDKIKKFGSVSHDEKPRELINKNIIHLQTRIDGMVELKHSTLDIINSLHPTPAVCGNPCKSSRDLISHMEKFNRGWFSGPVGWLDSNDSGSFFVALRCLYRYYNSIYIYAGAGITKDSDPEIEWLETELKMQTILNYFIVNE